MKRFNTLCMAVLLSSCAEKASVADSTAVPSKTVSAPAFLAAADSARVFTQRFYDWYLATEAKHGEPYDSLVTTRREWLSDTLARSLKADLAMQHADTLAEIASLSAEADIFLNSQDPCPRYTARAPRSLGADGFAVVVAGSCYTRDAKPNIEVQVRPLHAGWVIVNLRDPTEPKYDLLSAFARYRAEMAAPRDSVGKDTSRAGSA